MIQVSIIIPSYNSAHFLHAAINSVLANSLMPEYYEIIIIDDGSTDNITEVLRQYDQHENIHLVSQQNKGLSSARNAGIHLAKGLYVVFLDADDIVMPEKLRLQLEFLEDNKNIDVVYTKSVFFNDLDISDEINSNFPVNEGDILNNLLYGNFIHVNSAMARKTKIVEAGGFDENFRELEDWDLWLRLSLLGAKFGHINLTLSKVRLHEHSMTANQAKMNKAMIQTLLNFKTILLKSPKRNKYIIDLYKALPLYAIKAVDNRFFILNLEALWLIKHRFVFTFLKNMIKMTLVRFRIIDNNLTTKKLEKIWRNA
jgi:glycosyltransferase involved in cell wall biosynthesis